MENISVMKTMVDGLRLAFSELAEDSGYKLSILIPTYGGKYVHVANGTFFRSGQENLEEMKQALQEADLDLLNTAPDIIEQFYAVIGDIAGMERFPTPESDIAELSTLISAGWHFHKEDGGDGGRPAMLIYTDTGETCILSPIEHVVLDNVAGHVIGPATTNTTIH